MANGYSTVHGFYFTPEANDAPRKLSADEEKRLADDVRTTPKPDVTIPTFPAMLTVPGEPSPIDIVAKDEESVERYVGRPFDAESENVERERLFATVRKMMAHPDEYTPYEHSAALKKLNKRMMLADQALLNFKERFGGEGVEPSALLATYVGKMEEVADILGAAAGPRTDEAAEAFNTEQWQRARQVLGDTFSSKDFTETEAAMATMSREEKAAYARDWLVRNGKITRDELIDELHEDKLTFAVTDAEKRAWFHSLTDEERAEATGMWDPEMAAMIDAQMQGKPYLQTAERLELARSPAAVKYRDMIKRREKWVREERLLSRMAKSQQHERDFAAAVRVIPFMNHAQKQLVAEAAEGKDLNRYRGVFKLMDDKTRETMEAVMSSVRPETEAGFASGLELGTRRFFNSATEFATTAFYQAFKDATAQDQLAEEQKFNRAFDTTLGWDKLKDPSGWWEKAWVGLGESMPLQGSAIGGALAFRAASKLAPHPLAKFGITAVGAAAEGLGLLSMAGDEYENLIDNGVDRNDAVILALAAGTGNWMIENMNTELVLGTGLKPQELMRIGWLSTIKAAARNFSKKSVEKYGRDFLRREFMETLRADAAAAFKIMISETFEEFEQGIVSKGTELFGKGEKPLLTAFISPEAIEHGAKSFAEAIPTCTLFGISGAMLPAGSRFGFSTNRQAVQAIVSMDEWLDAHLDEKVRQLGLAEQGEKFVAEWKAGQKKIIENRAAQIVRATDGMSIADATRWINEQEDMLPNERAFYADMVSFYNAAKGQVGENAAKAYVDSNLQLYRYEAGGAKFAVDGETGRLTSVTFKGDEGDVTIGVNDMTGETATRENLGPKVVTDFIRAWNEKNPDAAFSTDDPAKMGEEEAKRLDAELAKGINGFYSESANTITLTSEANAGTLAHETGHATIWDALQTALDKQKGLSKSALRRIRTNAEKALGISRKNDEATAETVEAKANIEGATYKNALDYFDTIDGAAAVKNVGRWIANIFRSGTEKLPYLPVVRTGEVEAISPLALVNELVTEAMPQALAAERARQQGNAADAARGVARRGGNAADAVALRQKKREAVRAQKKAEWQEIAKRQWESAEAKEKAEREFWEKAEAEIKAEEERINAEEAEARAAVEADDEQRRLDEEHERKMNAAGRKPPRLTMPDGMLSAEGERITAAYNALWKKAMGRKLTRADVKALRDKKSRDKIGQMRITVPDKIVATAAEAAYETPNVVYDPVSDTFVEGRIVVDAVKANRSGKAGIADFVKSRGNAYPALRFWLDHGRGLVDASDPYIKAYLDGLSKAERTFLTGFGGGVAADELVEAFLNQDRTMSETVNVAHDDQGLLPEDVLDQALQERAAYLDWKESGGLTPDQEEMQEAYERFRAEGHTDEEWKDYLSGTGGDVTEFSLRDAKSVTVGELMAAKERTRFSLDVDRRHEWHMANDAEYRTAYDQLRSTKGWLKAPNGKDTKLDPVQWVQVRTPSFKRWFGDWIKAEVTKRWFDVADRSVIDQLAPVDISSAQPLSGKKAIAEAFKGFGTVVNVHDGRTVRFPSNSAGKMVYQKRFAAAFDSLFRTSVRAWSKKENPVVGHKPHENIENFHSYVNKFTDGTTEYYIRFTVRENKTDGDVSKNNVHSAEISDVTVYEKTEASPLPNNQTGRRDASNTGKKPHVDSKISYFLEGVNPDSVSKVVDENGEPLVVYHGSEWHPLEEPSGHAVFRQGTRSDIGIHFGTKDQASAVNETKEFGSGKRVAANAYFIHAANIMRIEDRGENGPLNLKFLHGIGLSEDVANRIDANVHNPEIISKRFSDLIRRDYGIDTSKHRNKGELLSAINGVREDRGQTFVDFDTLNSYRSEAINSILVDELSQEGIDGFVYRNEYEGEGDSYVVFSPAQIKSATDNTGAFSPANPDIRFSLVAPAEDAAYVDAVKRGDRATALRMIREVAAKAMPNTKVTNRSGELMTVFHGTPNGEFTVFDENKIGDTWDADSFGFFFTESKSLAKDYTKPFFRETTADPHLFEVYLNIKNPLVIDSKWWRENFGRSDIYKHDAIEIWDTEQRTIIDAFNDGNYDGIIIDPNPMGLDPKMYVATSPSQIKSADITYDDAGNLVPLSKRFNPNNPDIRFSISPVYTGSAADYDRPSLVHVGTGEGSQVYGWGLYGSNVRGVAENYSGRHVQSKDLLYKGKEIPFKVAFPRNATAEDLALKHARSTGSLKSAISSLENEIDKDKTHKAQYESAIAWLKEHESDFEKKEFHDSLYSQTFFTNRAPGDESHLLSWYEPVSDENGKRVAEQLNKEPVHGSKDYKYGMRGGKGFLSYVAYNGKTVEREITTGESLYDYLASLAFHSPKAASEFLARADIDGIKYPVDSYGGKGVKDGDKAGWNYVSFRDDNIRVDHKWVDGQTRFSIAGNSAIDPSDKVKAWQMLKAGATREAIYDETGLWRGKDGNWRVELPDVTLQTVTNMRLLMMDPRIQTDKNGTKVATLGDLAYLYGTDNELANILSYYPDATNVRLFLHRGKKTRDGYQAVTRLNPSDDYRGNGKRENQAVAISIGMGRDNRDVRRSFVHELQHVIQGEEGWENGTTRERVGSREEYRRSPGEMEAEVAAVRSLEEEPGYAFGKSFYPWETEDAISAWYDKVFASDAEGVSSVYSKRNVDGVKFSLASPELQEKLDRVKTITVYRSMQIGPDGKLYPPMAAIVDGKRVTPIEFDKWFVADEPIDIDEMIAKGQMRWHNGTLQFYLEKGDDSGSDIWAAYNPYWHTSNRMLNDQFSSAYKRNLVTVECAVPVSEDGGAYRAKNAKNATGWTGWHSGQVATWLEAVKPENRRDVFLSRYCKVKRIVPNAEVAASIAEDLKGTDIRIPTNVIPTALRDELKKLGVPLFETVDANGKFDTSAYTALKNDAMLNLILDANIDEMLSKFDEAKGKTKELIFKQYSHDQKVVAVLPADMALPTELEVETPEVRAAQNFLLDHVHNHPHEIAYDAADVKRVLKLINPANEMRVVPQRQSSSLAFIGANPKGGWDCVVIAPRRGKFYVLKTLFGQKRKPYQSKAQIRYSMSDSSGRNEAVGSLLRGPLASIRDVNQTPPSIPNSGAAAQPRLSRPSPRTTRFSLNSDNAERVAALVGAVGILRGETLTDRNLDAIRRSVRASISIPDLRREAERLADENRRVLNYVAHDKKISRLVARAGLADRMLNAIDRSRQADLSFAEGVRRKTERINRSTERVIRDTQGFTADTMLNELGIDPASLLLSLRPAERAQPERTAPTDAEQTTDAPHALDPALMKAAQAKAAALIGKAREAVARAKVEQEKKSVEIDEDGRRKDGREEDAAGEEEDSDEIVGTMMQNAILAEIKKSGITLDNAAEMVKLAEVITEDYIRNHAAQYQGIDLSDVWEDPRARALLGGNISRFAQMAAEAYCPTFTRERVAKKAQMLDDKAVRSLESIEEIGVHMFEDLNRDLIRETRKDLIRQIHKKIDNLARKHNENTLNEERKVSSAISGYLKKVKKAIDMSAAKVEERIAELETLCTSRYQGLDEEKANHYRDYSEAQDEIYILSYWGNLKAKMPSEIKADFEYLDQLVNEDLARMMQTREDYYRHIEETVAAMVGGIAPDPKSSGKKPTDDPWAYSVVGMFEAKYRQYVRFCKDPAKAQAAREAFAQLEQMIQDSLTDEVNFVTEYREKMKKLIDAAYGSASNARKMLTETFDAPWYWVKVEGDKNPQVEDDIGLTAKRALQMYVSIVQDDYIENVEKWGRNGEYRAKLERLLGLVDESGNPIPDSPHAKFIEGLRSLYLEMGQRLDGILVETTGTHLRTPNRNYMPVKMDRRIKRGKNGEGRAFSPFAPSLTPRIRNGRDFDQTADIVDMFLDRISDTAHTIGWAKTGPLVMKIAQSDAVINTIENNFGDKEARRWNNYIFDIVAGPKAANVRESQAMKNVMRYSSLLWLGLNLASWAKQLAGVPCLALSNQVTLRDCAAGLSMWALKPIQMCRAAYDLAKTEAFKGRYGSAISNELRYAISDDGGFATWKSKLARGIMSGIIGADKLGVLMCAGIYFRRRQQLEMQGKTADEASELASCWMMAIVDKTMQSGRTVNLTEAQRNGGFAGFLQYKSSPIQQAQFEIAAYEEWAADKTNGEKLGNLVKTIVVNHFAVPFCMAIIDAAFAFLTSWGIPDEDKRKRLYARILGEILGGPFSALFLVGAFVEYASDVIAQFATGSSSKYGTGVGQLVPAEGALEFMGKNAEAIVDALCNNDKAEYAETAAQIGLAIGNLTPGASWLTRTGKKIYDSVTEDPREKAKRERNRARRKEEAAREKRRKRRL